MTRQFTALLAIGVVAGTLAEVPLRALSLETETLTLSLEAASAWTIRSVDFGDKRVIVPAGGQGAVILPDGGGWIGSAMGRDEADAVISFEAFVDGELKLSIGKTDSENVSPVGGKQATLTGKSFLLKKHSKLGPIDHHATTSIEGSVIHQTHSFKAASSVKLKNFYAFIYSLSPKADTWTAESLEDRLLRGTFDASGAHRPGKQVRWLAQYDSKNACGVVAYFRQPFNGHGGSAHLWDKSAYHKLICQPMSGELPAGTELQLELVMQIFGGEPADWEAKASQIASTLQTRFPPTKAAMPEQKKIHGTGVPESGRFILQAGKYRVPFDGSAAWTIDEIHFDKIPVGLANGHYGTVLTPVGGKWWGTGHAEGGKEIVHSLKLTVDGVETPVKAGANYQGKQLRLVKHSTVWKFKVEAEVEVGEEHIYERTRMEAVEDCDLKLLYYFMHCFPPVTDRWLASLPDGKLEEGPLTAAGNMAINRDTRWVAQRMPKERLGLLCYTPKVISGPKSRSMIWDLDRYHKYYIRQNEGQSFKKGETMEFSVIVKVVPEESGDWSATKAAARKLEELYPAE